MATLFKCLILNKKMKQLFSRLTVLLLFAALHARGNTAQPGIFQAGGTASFILLYPEDSASFQKIQMVAEKITIQLYRGYGVVKGEYKMYNTTASAITIKTGYPVNATLKAGEKGATGTRIFFDELYALKSYTNGQENKMMVKPGPAEMIVHDENNWYVWENSFKPMDTTLITVYFIVNTNNTIIRQGYTVDRNNGFIYLLETGATWKQPIIRGEIKIGLMDNIRISDIGGASPASAFRADDDHNILLYQFSNLSPSFKDNIIVTYTPNLKQFDFGLVAQKAKLLFDAIDSFSEQKTDESKLTSHTFKDPYKVRSANYVKVVVIAIVVVVSILVLAVVALLARPVIRFFKNKAA